MNLTSIVEQSISPAITSVGRGKGYSGKSVAPESTADKQTTPGRCEKSKPKRHRPVTVASGIAFFTPTHTDDLTVWTPGPAYDKRRCLRIEHGIARVRRPRAMKNGRWTADERTRWENRTGCDDAYPTNETVTIDGRVNCHGRRDGPSLGWSCERTHELLVTRGDMAPAARCRTAVVVIAVCQERATAGDDGARGVGQSPVRAITRGAARRRPDTGARVGR